MTPQDLKELVTSMFDEPVNDIELPESFAEVEPAAFAREVIRQKAKRAPFETIVVNVYSLGELGQAVLEKLTAARQQLTGKKFDELWDAFELSLDYGILGGDPWLPHIMLNGGVAVRNHHRVIAMDQPPEAVLVMSRDKLYEELQTLQDHIDPDEPEDEKDIRFSILHHGHDGFLWTRTIPQPLSAVGQTLVFIPHMWLKRAVEEGILPEGSMLTRPEVLEIAQNSRSGHCVLRVFKNRTFVHSTYRASDEYDILLEEFSDYVGDTTDSEDGPFQCLVCTGFEHLKSSIQERIGNNMGDFSDFRADHVMNVLCEDKLKNQYAQKKAVQTTAFERIFDSSSKFAASYSHLAAPYAYMQQSEDASLVSFTFRASVLKTLEQFEKNFYRVASRVADKLPGVTVKLQFTENTRYIVYANEDDLLEWKSEEASIALKEIAKALRKDLRDNYPEHTQSAESKAECMQQVLDSSDAMFSLVFFLEGDADPAVYHRVALDISKELDTSLTLGIPAYGLDQGYCCGELDTGNASMLLVGGAESEDADSESDDEDSDIEEAPVESDVESAESALAQKPAEAPAKDAAKKGSGNKLNSSADWPFAI